MIPNVGLFESRAHPRILWFSFEGLLLGVVGLLVRLTTGAGSSLNLLGTVAMLVGGLTVVMGILVYGIFVLVLD